jgi:F-type H+-transporting ATPase subunit b
VLIDWFTVAVQIVNFLILMALLKYFLYGRIVRAMEEREGQIAGRLAAAERQQQTAEAEAAMYRQQQQALTEQHAELLALARAEAATQRQALLAEARREAEQQRARWQTALQHEQTAFLHDLRQRTNRHVCAIARRALRDLAGAGLEQQIIATFQDKLKTLDEATWQVFTTSERQAPPSLVIRSAFEVPQRTRQCLQSVLQERLGEAVAVVFQTAPELICGIELLGDGHKLVWGLEAYGRTLEERLTAVFEEGGRQASPEALDTVRQIRPSEEETRNDTA